MKDYQRDFLRFALDRGVLKFGDFTLKSGRKSPYFFNAGLFNTGMALASLGKFYARCAIDSNITFDMLFGPAYKGIPLVTVTAAALATEHGLDLPYCFNRKETKDHGEGGNLVGSPLRGRVLIIDDVITAGTAIRESLAIIAATGATAAGVIVALDRQEKGPGGLSAIQEISRDTGIPVASITRLEDLVAYLTGRDDCAADLKRLTGYRRQYGADYG